MRKEDSILNQIAAAVANCPGLTGAELSRQIGIPSAYRRLSEVAKLGLVEIGATRTCMITGKQAKTWNKCDKPQQTDLRPDESKYHMQKRMQARIDALVNEIAIRDMTINEYASTLKRHGWDSLKQSLQEFLLLRE